MIDEGTIMDDKSFKQDWRITNQESYLKGKKLVFRVFKSSDSFWKHEHCEFCMKKIKENSDGNKHETSTGYSTLDAYHWICAQCYDDFKDFFKWKIKE